MKKKNHSKIKARDIIPGWPRGRSTVSWIYQPWQCINCWWSFTSLNMSDEMKESLQLDIIYHAMQQAMVNEWFEGKRVQFEPPYRNALPGEIGHVYEITYKTIDGKTHKQKVIV